MSQLDFHIDYNLVATDLPESIEAEISERIQALTEGRNDLIGAAVAVEKIAGDGDSYLFEARIVAYLKPENIAVVEKGPSPENALKDALSVLERQVREERDRRRDYE